MEYLFLQTSKQSLLLTPAKAQGHSTTFGLTHHYELPPELRDGRALAAAKPLAELVKSCAAHDALHAKNIILCLENDHLHTLEYQHLPCSSPANLAKVAKLKIEGILPGDAENFLVLNAEYHSTNEADGKQNAAVFAVEKKLLTTLYHAFQLKGMRLAKAVPTIGGLMNIGLSLAMLQPKTIALIDLGFQQNSLLILNNGTVAFQHTFDGIFNDIIDIVQNDQRSSYTDAVQTARTMPLTPDNGIISAPAAARVVELLNAAVEEIVRTLRMILSSARLDISALLVLGAMADLPNFKTYLQGIEMDIPKLSIMEYAQSAGGHIVLPEMTPEAKAAGTQADSYGAFSGILTAKKAEQLDFMALLQSSSSPASRAAVMVLCSVLAAAVMAVEPLNLMNMQNQITQDKQMLANPTLLKAKALNTQMVSLKTQLAGLLADRKLLPYTKSQSQKIYDQIQLQIVPQVTAITSCNISNSTGLVTITITTAGIDKYLALRKSLEQNGYFIPSVTQDVNVDEHGVCQTTMNLQVKNFVAWSDGSASSAAATTSTQGG